MSSRPKYIDTAVGDFFIKWASRVNAFLFRRSKGAGLGSTMGGIPVALLITKGRKTGEPRTSPLYFYRDPIAPDLSITEDDLDLSEMLNAYFRVQGYDCLLPVGQFAKAEAIAPRLSQTVLRANLLHADVK